MKAIPTLLLDFYVLEELEQKSTLIILMGSSGGGTTG